uniref:Uncharacterized protein n=1 Tax=Mesocestoides corti TaxID=53468 RepID=A0A5K3EWF2_MESCO
MHTHYSNGRAQFRGAETHLSKFMEGRLVFPARGVHGPYHSSAPLNIYCEVTQYTSTSSFQHRHHHEFTRLVIARPLRCPPNNRPDKHCIHHYVASAGSQGTAISSLAFVPACAGLESVTYATWTSHIVKTTPVCFKLEPSLRVVHIGSSVVVVSAADYCIHSNVGDQLS